MRGEGATQAELDALVAQAFGRRKSLEEARLDAAVARVFGAPDDDARFTALREAEAAARQAQERAEQTLRDEVTALVESRFGMSPQRARLYARSEALRCQDAAGPGNPQRAERAFREYAAQLRANSR